MPPGLSGEVLEELRPGERIQCVQDGVDLVDRSHAQKDVGVVIGKVFDERRRKVDRQRPKQALLFFEREAHEGLRRDGRIEPSEERDGVLPARVRDKPPELFGRSLGHDSRRNSRYTPVNVPNDGTFKRPARPVTVTRSGAARSHLTAAADG